MGIPSFVPSKIRPARARYDERRCRRGLSGARFAHPIGICCIWTDRQRRAIRTGYGLPAMSPSHVRLALPDVARQARECEIPRWQTRASPQRADPETCALALRCVRSVLQAWVAPAQLARCKCAVDRESHHDHHDRTWTSTTPELHRQAASQAKESSSSLPSSRICRMCTEGVLSHGGFAAGQQASAAIRIRSGE